MIDDIRMLTVAEVAEALGLGEQVVRARCARGELPAVNVGTDSRAMWRVPKCDLDQWIEERRAKADRD